MPPKFGTSGLRGLVTELTPALVADHLRAFLRACPVGTGLFVGRDLRPSSPDLAKVLIATAQAEGVTVTDCGDILTPALALAAMSAGASAVMITGSHIPADRNGLKFYTPDGEITKDHEAAILANLGHPVGSQAAPSHHHDASPAYVARYSGAFGEKALDGMTIGVYTHSTVGRDVMMAILRALGATVIEMGRSDSFIPVDTEAVAPDTRKELRAWAQDDSIDAIVSMDGDGDRPLLTDAAGEVVPGDVLGQITAKSLGAQNVVTPVSSNTGVSAVGFEKVTLTRIGSPFVIAGMEETGGQVVGYEANGGFLLGFAARGPAGLLPPLMTRDSILPIVAVLHAAKGRGVTAAIADMPARFTAADRLQEVPTETSKALVSTLTNDPSPLLERLSGTQDTRDLTDGLRMTLRDGRIVHLRPSGNAPELRCYVESSSKAEAADTLQDALQALRELTR